MYKRQEKSWLVNYNFREYYEDNKIKFDYILRSGKSKTQNAKQDVYKRQI